MTFTGNHQQLARLAGFISIVLLSLTVGGCTAPPTPTPSSTATTHWKDGVEPTPNDLENTPYVKYLRDIAWAEAIAWNTGDFSIPEYNDHGWGMDAREAESRFQMQGNHAYVYLAPKPFVPIKIQPSVTGPSEESDPTSVDVSICRGPKAEYEKMVDGDLQDTLYTKNYVEIHLMTIQPDGQVTDSAGGSNETCDDVNVPVALFDNPPTLPELPVAEPKHTAPIATK